MNQATRRYFLFKFKPLQGGEKRQVAQLHMFQGVSGFRKLKTSSQLATITTTTASPRLFSSIRFTIISLDAGIRFLELLLSMALRRSMVNS